MSSGIPASVFMGKECSEREPLPGMIGVRLQVQPPRHQNQQSGMGRSRSVALRVLSNPDPNPGFSLK